MPGAQHRIATFGELRSTLQRGPRGWSDATLLLENWLDREELLTRAIPYTRDHIASWPLDAATAPRRWKRALLKGYEIPALATLDSLNLKNMPARGWRSGLGQLMKLECTRHLTELDISNGNHRASDIEKLLGGAGRFPDLRVLRASQNSLSSATFFFENPRVSVLRLLDLRDCGIESRHIDHMVHSGKVQNLERLKLSHNKLNQPGMRALCKANNLTSLRGIDLHKVGIDARGLASLAQAPWLEQLEWLSISIDETRPIPGRDAFITLLSSPRLANLRCLILGNTWIDDRVLTHISRQAHLSNLERLGIFDYPHEKFKTYTLDTGTRWPMGETTQAGARAIAESPLMTEELRSYWSAWV